MSVAYESLINHLDDNGFRYLPIPSEKMVAMHIGTDEGVYQLVARVAGDEDLFQIIGQIPVRVPPGCRSDVAEAITRANYGLAVGRFEMDYGQGTIQFQAATLVEDEPLPGDLICRLICTAVAMLDRYVPAIMGVIYANELPKDAIGRVEARSA